MSQLNVIHEKILIDAGPSAEGWSKLESFSRCERLYFLLHKAEGHEEHWKKDVLVRGSIGHVGLAHEYARRAAAKAGQDPDIYYTRDEAMELSAASFGEMGKEMLAIAKPVVDDYFEHYKRENLDVVAIESPVRAVLADGTGITQRLDLVIRDLDGRYWIMDHKLVNNPYQVDRYTLSGQFLLMRHFGRLFYGTAFGGVQVNLLGCRKDERKEAKGLSPYTFKRSTPEPAPAALADFPEMVIELRKRIAAKDGQPGSAYLPAFNEQICCGPYGRCSMFEKCMWDGAK
jgi:hypothetical protein